MLRNLVWDDLGYAEYLTHRTKQNLTLLENEDTMTHKNEPNTSCLDPVELGDTIWIGRREFTVTELDPTTQRVTLVEVNALPDDTLRLTSSARSLNLRILTEGTLESNDLPPDAVVFTTDSNEA